MHYPFCYSKCDYCSFYSIKYNTKKSKKYIEALKNEFEIYSKKYDFSENESIYIGGGTPSLNIEEIKLIDELLDKSKALKSVKEYTIECNPSDVSVQFIKDIVTTKCNRISFGIQSFDDNVIKDCGRERQDINKVYRAMNMLESEDFSVSIDLINGLPGMDFGYELEKLKDLITKYKCLKHISLYDLTIEKGSKFYENKNMKLPEEEDKIFYEEEFRKLTKKYGFIRYEVSNYSKIGFQSIHNKNYWHYKNYIGLGPGAQGTVGNLRIENVPDINKYISQKNYKSEYKLTKMLQMEECLLMGLRLLEGINIWDFYERFGYELDDIAGETIKTHAKMNNLKIKKGYLFMTEKGMNILNTILVNLFSEIERKI